MGGPHRCVVAEPEEPLERNVAGSRYVVIEGQELDYLMGLMERAVSGSFGPLTQVRVVFNSGAMCIGTNGQASKWIGDSG